MELERGALLSLEQAWRLALAWYGFDRGNQLRRKNADEAEALFAELGLTARSGIALELFRLGYLKRWRTPRRTGRCCAPYEGSNRMIFQYGIRHSGL